MYPKELTNKVYPVQAENTSGLLTRVEPLLTPEKLKSRHLKGILDRLPPGIKYSKEELKDEINIAVNELESELKVPIFAEQFSERHAFDANLYKHYIHIRTNNGPIISVEDFAIVSSNGENIFRIPAEWVELGNAHQRLLNVIPLLGVYGQGSVSGAIAPGGTAYLFVVERQLSFVPSYWTIKFTAGVCKDPGTVPIIVNNLIGTYTAMNILSNLAALNVNNSVSLGQDSISQSSSGPGVQIYVTRMGDLEKKKRELLGQLKRIFAQKFIFENI